MGKGNNSNSLKFSADSKERELQNKSAHSKLISLARQELGFAVFFNFCFKNISPDKN